MKKNTTLLTGMLLAMLTILLTACSKQAAETNTVNPTQTEKLAPAQQSYSDPFAYCAAVGTIDTPDARYTGPKISDEIINGFKVAAGLQSSTEPMEMFKQTTIWRCMDSQVYACNFGANLPCSSKANTDKTPTSAMDDYCKANPDSEFIPMSVTGHSTIYSWHCVKDTPELLDQIAKVDAAGYLENIWYKIALNANPQPEINPTPTSEPTLEPTPTGVPTLPPTSTSVPTLPPTPTSVPTLTPTPMGGVSQILFSSNRDGAYQDLYLLDLTDSKVTRLTSGDSNTFPGPFSPDGTQILFTGFGLTHSYVGLMNADGSQPRDISHSPDSDEGFPTWSPDGKVIAFTSRRDGNNEIYVTNADGSQPKRLTNNPADDFAPAYSPDGSQIAFVSDRDNTTGIYSVYVMNTDGTHVTRLTKAPGNDYMPSWSPDGKQIVFRSTVEGSSDIYIINIDGSGLKKLTEDQGDNWSPAWSPDGKLIAFQTNRDGNWEIYVMNADGSDQRNLTDNPADDQMPYWKK